MHIMNTVDEAYRWYKGSVADCSQKAVVIKNYYPNLNRVYVAKSFGENAPNSEPELLTILDGTKQADIMEFAGEQFVLI
jgi:hypothetical protein